MMLCCMMSALDSPSPLGARTARESMENSDRSETVDFDRGLRDALLGEERLYLEALITLKLNDLACFFVVD